MLEFVVELVFSGIFELAKACFFPNSAHVSTERKPNNRNSEYGHTPGIVGLAVLLSLLISGLWFSHLHP